MRAVVLSVSLAAGCISWAARADVLHLSGMGFGSYSIPVTSIKEARFKATLRQHYDFSCGSAALATLLTHHYGHTVNEESVFEAMFAAGNHEKIRKEGFSLLDMKKYLNKQGYEADGFELPLRSLLDAKLPAIVLVTDKGYQHFVVVKGLKDGRILLGDPAGGTRAMSVAAFESIWSNKVLFVIHSQRENARFNLATDWELTPRAPVRVGWGQSGSGFMALDKFNPGDF